VRGRKPKSGITDGDAYGAHRLIAQIPSRAGSRDQSAMLGHRFATDGKWNWALSERGPGGHEPICAVFLEDFVS